MRHLQYLEIRNFKGFGDKVRIELDHPAVLAGPNNCGKTTALQAIALWSQAVRTWFDRKGRAPPKERTATGLNRLAVVAVPVRSAREYWHNMAVRTGPRNVPLEITLGVLHDNRVKPVTMRFRCFGDETVYCTPDEATLDIPEFIRTAADLNVRLLYPMSGIETEEPIVSPEVLRAYAAHAYRDLPLFEEFRRETDEVLDDLLLDRVFDARERDLLTWKGMDADAARLLWEARTERLKLSDFAEEFFRRQAEKLGHAMLLRKRDLHRLVDFIDADGVAEEVSQKLGLLANLFAGTSGPENSA